jgi:hypothetical protein
MTRVVRSWLRTDEHESAGRVLDNVLAALDATPQRRAPMWPAWRIAEMNRYVKLAAAAAAVLVVAVVVYNLLPGLGSVGSPGATVTAAPITTLRDEAGTFSVTVDGAPMAVTFPAGWRTGLVGEAGGAVIDKQLPQGEASIFIWNPDNVYADSCAHTNLSPPAGPNATDFGAAVTEMVSIEVVTAPIHALVDEQVATHVVIVVPEDAPCSPGPGGFQLWYNEDGGDGCIGDVECPRFATALGDTIRLWLVDVNGGRVIFEAETPKGTGTDVEQEIQAIIDSIRFE